MSRRDVDPGASEPDDPFGRLVERLGSRRLIRAAVALLALLYGSAIYAPLLANDRPYVLEAVDRAQYERARRSVLPVTLALKGLVCGGEAAYLEQRTGGSTQGWREAVAAEHRALTDRLGVLRLRLTPEHHGELDVLARRAGDVVWALRPASKDDACGLAADLPELAARVRDGCAPHGPDRPDGVQLLATRSYPLRDSLGGLEVGLMVLWAFVLAWPVWNRLVNRRLASGGPGEVRRWRGVKVALVLGASLVAGLGWHATVGGATAFHVAPYKEDLDSGAIEAQRVVFPPVPFGFAETHLEELFRPPTWTAAAEIDAEGRRVRDAREEGETTGPAANPVPVANPVPLANPVVVRAGEPARNSPWRHPLGTDSVGRDLLARLLWGGRVSLAVGLVSTTLLVLIGVLVGCVAGYLGGRVDLLVSRLIEVVICFPVFFLILAVVALVGPSILNVMVVIGCLRWTGVARLTRAELLRLREQDFAVAARALGLSHRRIVLRHLLPNALGPLLVAATFALAAGLLVESALSFLGFGIEAPIPSWGALINDSRSAEHWWIQLFPGALIFLTVLATNLVGDALRDALDPRTRA